jgi:hypothetical protein
MEGSCKHDNEALGSVRDRELIGSWACQQITKDSDP